MKFFAFLFIIAFLGGCSLAPVAKCVDDSTYATETNFKNTIERLSYSIVQKLDSNEYSHSHIIITDFVNLNHLDNKADLGFVLSSELKTQLNNKVPTLFIKVLELGKDIKIGQNGVKIITRNINELKQKEIKQDSYVVVGKYTITPKKLIIYLEMIDYASSQMIASGSAETALTKEIEELEEKNSRNSRIFKPLVL